MHSAKPENYADYAARFPHDVQRLLRQMRATIRKGAPRAVEVISYRIPAFKLDGRMLVWFAAHANHIGLYPGASGIAEFKKELARYKHAKGSVQFPLDERLPLALIARIVKFRVNERPARQKSST